MSKLREKFKKAFPYFPSSHFDECEQITYDFSIAFAEWLAKNVKLYDGNSGYLNLKDRFLTTTELQQYFKNEIYGKEQPN